MNYYYDKVQNSEEKVKEIKYRVSNIEMYFETNSGVFSRNFVDFGTDLMINTIIEKIEIKPEDKLLDIGCGYGVIGISLSKVLCLNYVVMADVNERAIEASKNNCRKNGVEKRISVVNSDLYENIDELFDIIVTNPPIRAGKKVVNKIIEDGYSRLTESGKFVVVIQKKQGAESYMKRIREVYGNCEIIERKVGYRVMIAKKIKNNEA